MDTNDAVLRDRVKTMIVECARLKIQPSELKDDAPLFDKEKGLGLDSIDVLELVVNIENIARLCNLGDERCNGTFLIGEVCRANQVVRFV